MAGEPRSDSESDTEEDSALLRRSPSPPPPPCLQPWPPLFAVFFGCCYLAWRGYTTRHKAATIPTASAVALDESLLSGFELGVPAAAPRPLLAGNLSGGDLEITSPVPALRCHLSPGGSDCVEPIVLPGWRRVELPGGVTADRAPADGSQILEVGVAGLPREADLDAAAAARLSELRRRCPGYFARDAATVHKGRLA